MPLTRHKETGVPGISASKGLPVALASKGRCIGDNIARWGLVTELNATNNLAPRDVLT